MVSINPMNKDRELRLLLDDSGARALITHEALYDEVAAGVVPDTDVDDRHHDVGARLPRRRPGAAAKACERTRAEGTHDLLELVREHEGQRPDPVAFGPDDVAFLTYTSGTTGPPKGAMNTHGNVVFNSQAYRDWCELGEDDVCLGGGAAVPHHRAHRARRRGAAHAAAAGALLPLRPGRRRLDLVAALRRPTFTVASITVFIALMNDRAVTPRRRSPR